MKRKLITILSLMLVIALGLGVLVACQKGPSTEQLDSLYKEFTKLHKNDAKESATSFWVEGDVFVLEDGGKEISVKIKWTIEGTTLVKVGETPNSNGQYQIIVPDEVDEEVNYKLVGVMVDEKGNAYTDKDGKEYKLEISKVVPAGKGQGTVDSPYSVAGLLAEMITIPEKGFSENKLYVSGIVITAPSYNANYKSYSFWIADSKDSTQKLQIYSGTLQSGIDAVYQNDTVVVNGYYMNYSPTNPELTGSKAEGTTPARDYPVVTSRTIGTSAITAPANENAEVTLGKTSGLNGEKFTFTVTAKNNATISSVKVNGTEVAATSGNNYEGTIEGDTEITVVALVAAEGEQTANINFATNFATYAKDWGNSYAARKIDSAALDVTNMDILISIARAAKQTQTITTMPVLAPNSNTTPMYTTIAVNGKAIKSITLNLEMWAASKKFNTIALDYTVDGTTWEEVEGVGIRNAEKAVSLENYITLTVSNLPANVKAVRLVLLSGYESGNQQVGLKSLNITVGDKIDEPITPVEGEAKIGNTSYATLLEAIEAAKNGQTIVLQKDVVSGGIFLEEGSRNFTIDLNKHTLTIGKPLVGSTGTVSQSIHLEKGNTVVFKNGTITSEANSASMLVQNYCNLTLDNVTLDGSKLAGEGTAYTLSNNFGTILIKGGSKIIARETKGIAFDLWYGMFAQYDEGLSVTVEAGCTITGKIEYGAASRIEGTDWVEKAVLILPEGTYDIVLTRNDITREDANITIGTADAE